MNSDSGDHLPGWRAKDNWPQNLRVENQRIGPKYPSSPLLRDWLSTFSVKFCRVSRAEKEWILSNFNHFCRPPATFLGTFSTFLWKSCLDFVILRLLNCWKCKPTASIAPTIMTLHNYNNIQRKMKSPNRIMIWRFLKVPDFCSINESILSFFGQILPCRRLQTNRCSLILSIFAVRWRNFWIFFSGFLWISCLDFVILGILNC